MKKIEWDDSAFAILIIAIVFLVSVGYSAYYIYQYSFSGDKENQTELAGECTTYGDQYVFNEDTLKCEVQDL